MRGVIALSALAICLIGDHADACSFGPGFRIARPPSSVGENASGQQPSPPVVSALLTRGYDDGDSASCSDAGVLTFTLEGESSSGILGYEFRLVSGEFPDEVELPSDPVLPIEFANGESGFRFVWLDLPAGTQLLAPIDVTIEVRQQSVRGAPSEPVRLEIQHRGGVPRENLPDELQQRLRSRGR